MASTTTLQKAKQTLDIFSVNPQWSFKDMKKVYTFKTLFVSLLIFALSLFSSWGEIENLWLPVDSLRYQRTDKSSLNYKVKELIVGVSFTKFPNYPANGKFDPSVNFFAYYVVVPLVPINKNITRMASCPSDFSKATLCLKIEDSDLKISNQTPFMVIDSQYEDYVGIKLWFRNYNASTLLYQTQPDVIDWELPSIGPCMLTLRVDITEVVIFNSLSISQPPQIRVGVHPAKPQFAPFCAPGRTFKQNLGIFGSNTVYSLTYVRQDFTIILGAVVSQIQLYVAILAFLFLRFPKNWMSLETIKQLYYHLELSKVQLSMGFMLKSLIYDWLAMIGVHEWVQSKTSWFREQILVNKIVDYSKQILSLQNTLTRLAKIQNFRVPKLITQGNVLTSTNNYMKMTVKKTMAKSVSFDRLGRNTRLVKRIPQVPKQPISRLASLIRSFDANPRLLQFQCNPEYSSSWPSIILTVAGIAAIIFGCIQMNAFGMSRSITYSNYFNSRQNLTLDGFYLKLFPYGTYTQESRFPNIVADGFYNLTFDYIDQNEKVVGHPKIGREEECFGFGFSYTGMISKLSNFCADVDLSFNPTKTLRIRIDYSNYGYGIPYAIWFIDMPQYFIDQADPDGSFVLMNSAIDILPGQKVTVVLAPSQSQSGEVKAGFTLLKEPRNTQTQTQIIFSLQNLTFVQTLNQQTIYDLVVSLFNLNMLLLMILASWISRPINSSYMMKHLTDEYQLPMGGLDVMALLKGINRLEEQEAYSIKGLPYHKCDLAQIAPGLIKKETNTLGVQ